MATFTRYTAQDSWLIPCQLHDTRSGEVSLKPNVPDYKEFARKLIQAGATKELDQVVSNEVRALLKFCHPATHSNIITILRHGPLANSTYYFIDMELCDFNLNTYIEELWTPTPDDERLGFLPDEPNRRMRYVWTIMSQIASGVTHIHSHKVIHRDLKPQNSS